MVAMNDFVKTLIGILIGIFGALVISCFFEVLRDSGIMN